MTQTEDLSLTTLGALDEDLPRRPEVKHGWWWPLALGGAVCLLVGGAAGYLLAPADEAKPLPVPEAPRPTHVLAAGSLLGQIGGTNEYPAIDGIARYRYAWPGQELVAPSSSTGTARAWRWELCDVPVGPDAGATDALATDAPATDAAAEAPGPLECAAVAGATAERFTAPPTDRNRLVRVIVTVDLGNDVAVDAATVPIAAVPWPDSVQPGDPPPSPLPSLPEVPAVPG
jgi:hypothetical protein